MPKNTNQTKTSNHHSTQKLDLIPLNKEKDSKLDQAKVKS